MWCTHKYGERNIKMRASVVRIYPPPPPPPPTLTENGACVYGWPWLTRLMVSRAKGQKASAFFIVPSVWGINDSSLLLILCGRGFLTFDYESTPAKKCIALFSPVRMVGKSFVSKTGQYSPPTPPPPPSENKSAVDCQRLANW